MQSQIFVSFLPQIAPIYCALQPGALKRYCAVIPVVAMDDACPCYGIASTGNG